MGAGVEQEGSDGNRFVGLSYGTLIQMMGDSQRVLLRRWFGRSVEGARTSAGRVTVPIDLTRETLLIYAEIARRAIAAGRDSLGVQKLRLELIERVLKARG
jgi:hypothetical protein